MEPPKKKIKVIDVGEVLINPMAIDEESLEIELRFDPTAIQERNNMIRAILAAQRSNTGESETAQRSFLEVAVRTLLRERFIFPVVGLGTSKAHNVLIRVPRRITAFEYSGGRLSLSEEQRAEIVGLMVAPAMLFLSIEDLAGTTSIDLATFRETGNYLFDVVSSILIDSSLDGVGAPPDRAMFSKSAIEKIDGLAADFVVVPLSSEAIDGLRSHVRFLKEFTASSAVALLSSANIQESFPHPDFVPKPRPEMSFVFKPKPDIEFAIVSIFGEEILRKMRFQVSSMCMLFQRNLVDFYEDIVVHGRDSDEANEKAKLSMIEDKNRERRRKVAISRVRNSNEARLLLLAVRECLGENFYEKMIAMIGDTLDPLVIKGALSPRENEIVRAVKSNWEKRWAGQVDNKCPHVGLVTLLRKNLETAETKNVLFRLSKFFSKWDPNDWITCSNCGRPVICPHVVEKMRMETKQEPYDTMRSRLRKYAIKYSSGVDIWDLYCRICGEKIAVEDVEELPRGDTGMTIVIPPLNKYVWRIAMEIFGSVRFPVVTDSRSFANLVSRDCSPLVEASEKNAIKSGLIKASAVTLETDTISSTGIVTEDIAPRTKLYAIVFVYAYVLNLLTTANGIGFLDVPRDSKSSIYAQKMVQHMSKQYSSTFGAVTKNGEFVLNRFKEAYRVILDSIGKQKILRPDSLKELLNSTVGLDPVYSYADHVRSLLVKRHGTAKEEFEAVVGVKIADILKVKASKDGKGGKIDLYKNIYTPPRELTAQLGKELREKTKESRISPVLLEEYIKSWTGAGEDDDASGDTDDASGDTDDASGDTDDASGAFLNAVETRYQTKGGKEHIKSAQKPTDRKSAQRSADRKSVQRSADRKPVQRSADRKSAQRSVDRKPVQRPADRKLAQRPADRKSAQRSADRKSAQRSSKDQSTEKAYSIVSYDLFAQYVGTVHSDEEYTEYLKKMEALAESEAVMLRDQRRGCTKPYHDFGFVDTFKFDETLLAPLTSIYDENGVPHRWDIFVYTDLKGKEHEFNVDALKESDLKLRLTDTKCSICGVRRSGTAKLNDEKTRASMDRNMRIGVLFTFFETRCPEGGIHEMEKMVCSKCGITDNAMRNKKSREAKAYYDKYRGKFEEEKTVYSEFEKIATRDISRVAPVDPKVETFVNKWKFDFGAIRNVSEMVGVETPMIESIGISEGRTGDDIRRGINLPPAPKTIQDFQIYLADALARDFISEYTIFRNAKRSTTKTSKRIEEFLSRNKLQYTYDAIEKELPNILEKFRYSYYLDLFKKTRSAEDVRLFIIDRICAMTEAIVKSGNLGKILGQRLFSKIVKTNYLRSKPEMRKFSFLIFTQGEQFNGIESTSGDYAPDTAGDTAEDILDQILVDEEGEHENPYSLEGMDYDGHNEGDDE